MNVVSLFISPMLKQKQVSSFLLLHTRFLLGHMIQVSGLSFQFSINFNLFFYGCTQMENAHKYLSSMLHWKSVFWDKQTCCSCTPDQGQTSHQVWFRLLLLPGSRWILTLTWEAFDPLQRTLSWRSLTGTEVLPLLNWAQAQYTLLVLMFFFLTAPKINSFSYKVGKGRTWGTMKCDRFTLFCTSE